MVLRPTRGLHLGARFVSVIPFAPGRPRLTAALSVLACWLQDRSTEAMDSGSVGGGRGGCHRSHEPGPLSWRPARPKIVVGTAPPERLPLSARSRGSVALLSEGVRSWTADSVALATTTPSRCSDLLLVLSFPSK